MVTDHKTRPAEVAPGTRARFYDRDLNAHSNNAGLLVASSMLRLQQLLYCSVECSVVAKYLFQRHPSGTSTDFNFGHPVCIWRARTQRIASRAKDGLSTALG